MVKYLFVLIIFYLYVVIFLKKGDLVAGNDQRSRKCAMIINNYACFLST